MLVKSVDFSRSAMLRGKLFKLILRLTGYLPISKTKTQEVLSILIGVIHISIMTIFTALPLVQNRGLGKSTIAIYVAYLVYFCKCFEVKKNSRLGFHLNVSLQLSSFHTTSTSWKRFSCATASIRPINSSRSRYAPIIVSPR